MLVYNRYITIVDKYDIIYVLHVCLIQEDQGVTRMSFYKITSPHKKWKKRKRI